MSSELLHCYSQSIVKSITPENVEHLPQLYTGTVGYTANRSLFFQDFFFPQEKHFHADILAKFSEGKRKNKTQQPACSVLL